MMRIARTLYTAWIAILPFALISATIANAQTPTVPVTTSTGLFTFSEHDRAIRVAIAFVEEVSAVVEATVRFFDTAGAVLEARRGDLRYGAPFIAELTRRDVGDLAEVLVRAEIVVNLPGGCSVGSPIMITVHRNSSDGIGQLVLKPRILCSGPETQEKQ